MFQAPAMPGKARRMSHTMDHGATIVAKRYSHFVDAEYCTNEADMNVEELSMIGPSVDLETVNSIHKKRLLAFVNHFVISTTSFLNTISKSCEQRFMTLENKIQKLEASIIILESKLNSVPGLKEEVSNVVIEEAEPQPLPEPEEPKPEEVAPEPAQAELSPELMKYVKMLQFGVPAQAVRLKLNQDGVDPALHEDVLSYNKSIKD